MWTIRTISGGPTNKGVTQKTYDAFRTRKKQPVQPVKSISEDETARDLSQRILAACEMRPDAQ